MKAFRFEFLHGTGVSEADPVAGGNALHGLANQGHQSLVLGDARDAGLWVIERQDLWRDIAVEIDRGSTPMVLGARVFEGETHRLPTEYQYPMAGWNWAGGGVEYDWRRSCLVWR